MKQNNLDTFTIATFDLMDVNCNWTRVLKATFLSSKSTQVSNKPILKCLSFQLQLEVFRDVQREAFVDKKCYIYDSQNENFIDCEVGVWFIDQQIDEKESKSFYLPIATFDLKGVNCNWTGVLTAMFLSSESGEVSYDPILGCINFQLAT